MEGVTVVTHPLVQHKLTLLRDKNRSTKSFRELCKEIGVLLCYEVTRDLPLTDVEIETPLIRMSTPRIAGKKLVFAVPTNIWALGTFRFRIIDLWRRSLRRRSQKDGTTWRRITKLANDFLPRARILHPSSLIMTKRPPFT
jgi:hypothetical protein